MRTPSAHARMFGQRAWLLAVALFLFGGALGAQVSERITAVRSDAYRPGAPLRVTVDLATAAGIERIEIAYRQFGQQVFARRELALSGTSASVDIPASDVAPPLMDYYLAVYGAGGALLETYPPADAQNHPNQLTLRDDEPGVSRDVIVLSPEDRERLNAEDVVISFSLLRADSAIDRAKTKVYVDGADLSASLVIDDELVILPNEAVASGLGAGEHTVRVELFDSTGTKASASSWSFVVRANSEESARRAATDYTAWKYRASARLEARNEDLRGGETPYRRATLSGSASAGAYTFTGRTHLTNEETPERQPQNRFWIGAESPWLNVGYGDSYPELSEFIMSGKRVRGLNGSLMLGPFRVDVVKGSVTRSVASEVLGVFPADSLAAEQQRDPYGAYAPYDTLGGVPRWARVRYGTFDRDLFVVRPTIGKEDSRISFSYLKAKDDVGSIRYGIRPQENLVVGSDFLLSFDRHAIEITGQAALGFVNKDITGGTLSDADIDSIFGGGTGDIDPDDVRTLKDYLGDYITVNQNLVPLSLKNSSTLAYDAGLRLNYFNNVFRFNYFRHGESFQSFGQSFYRADIRGFSVNDRLRVADNRVLLSAGLERFDDNTAQTKAATTTSTTGNLGVSYLSPNQFPSITLGYLLATNKNPLGPDSVAAVDDRTNRFLLQLNRQFDWDSRHSMSLGFSVSDRDDRSRRNLDASTYSISASDAVRFRFPLEANASLSVNGTTFSAADTALGVTERTFRYTTLSAGGLYRLYEERLHCAATVSPTFGDISRTLVDASARWFFRKDLSLQGQLSLYLNKDVRNDLIWSFVLRYDV